MTLFEMYVVIGVLLHRVAPGAHRHACTQSDAGIGYPECESEND